MKKDRIKEIKKTIIDIYKEIDKEEDDFYESLGVLTNLLNDAIHEHNYRNFKEKAPKESIFFISEPVGGWGEITISDLSKLNEDFKKSLDSGV